jgi:hypothetical protein
MRPILAFGTCAAIAASSTWPSANTTPSSETPQGAAHRLVRHNDRGGYTTQARCERARVQWPGQGETEVRPLDPGIVAGLSGLQPSAKHG